MHIVFVSYYSFACNSAGHIACLANALVELGNQVTVFVPFGSETASLHGEVRFRTHSFAELDAWLEDRSLHEEIIVVAWTPRENVRLFVEGLRSRLPCPYVVHLEDNEKLITELNLGQSYEKLEQLSPLELSDRFGPDQRLSHPHHFPAFLARATGLTMLMDTLAVFAEADQPFHVFWPGYNPTFFGERAIDYEHRRFHGIADDEFVLAYTGNTHQANRREVLSLYLAVTVLNRLGVKARLVRSGEDYVELADEHMNEMNAHVIKLGRLASQADVASVAATANAFVQPGKSDRFNDFRFPSKLPEFFALGRPVLLPATNLGRFVVDGQDCVVLRRGDAFDIAAQLVTLHTSPARAEMLARGALAFARKHFQWTEIAQDYKSFLSNMCVAPASTLQP